MSATPKDAPSDWFLAVRQSDMEGVAVFTVAGRIGKARAPEFSTALMEGIDRARGDVMVDLRGVDYISSAGLKAFESIAEHLGSQSRELILCNPTDAIRLTLDLAGPMANVRLEASDPAA